jgi:ribonuclease HI
MKEIMVFTDGSTLNNQKKGGRKGGAGVFFKDNDPMNISYPLVENKKFKVTNNVAELTATIMAIETILSSMKIGKKKIAIYSDSMYVINIAKEWAKKWEKNDWKKSNNKKVDNIDLVKKLYYYSLNLKIKFIHSKGHAKEPSKDDPNYHIWYGNHMADMLAVKASKSI